jgi:amino acid permease
MEPQKTQPFWVAFIFTMNSVVGSSVLNMPFVFSRGGILFGTIVQVLAFVVSLIISFQVLQAWSRVEKIYELMSIGARIKPVPLTNIIKNKKKQYIKHNEESKNYESDNLVDSKPLIVQVMKYEFCDMVKVTMGITASRVLCIIFLFHLFFGLVSYSSIFATCLTSNVPLFSRETCNIYEHEGFFNDCKVNYWIYLTFFVSLMTVLCFFHIIETMVWQCIAFTARILVFSIIIVSAIVAISTDTKLDDDGDLETSPEIFNISYYGKVTSIIFLATLNQNTLPLTSSFVEKKEKNLSRLVFTVSIVSFCLFLTTSIIVNYAADDVEKLVILNWRKYSAGHSDDERPWWCYLIIYVVILLPAIDVSSSFPITCASLAGNITGVFDFNQEETVLFR